MHAPAGKGNLVGMCPTLTLVKPERPVVPPGQPAPQCTLTWFMGLGGKSDCMWSSGVLQRSRAWG